MKSKSPFRKRAVIVPVTVILLLVFLGLIFSELLLHNEYSNSLSGTEKKVITGISRSGDYKFRLSPGGKLKFSGGLFYSTVDNDVDEYYADDELIVYQKRDAPDTLQSSVIVYRIESDEKITLSKGIYGGFAVGENEIIVVDSQEGSIVGINIYSLDGAEIQNIELEHKRFDVLADYYFASPYLFATGTSDGCVWLYNVETGEEKSFFASEEHVCYLDAAFDENGVYFSRVSIFNDILRKKFVDNEKNGLWYLPFDGNPSKISNEVFNRLCVVDEKLYGAIFGIRNNIAEGWSPCNRNGIIQKYYVINNDGSAEMITP